MTVSWEDVQNAIKAAVVSTNAVPASAVHWEDEPKPVGTVLVSLHVLYDDALHDRHTYSPHPTVAGSFIWELSTLYYVRIQIRAESVFTAPASDARFALERIRAGLLRPGLNLDAGLVIQPDEQTYVHHVSFPFDGHVISAYSYEIGFRAVVDFPLDEPQDAEPNMQSVVLDGDAEIGEPATTEIDHTVARP